MAKKKAQVKVGFKVTVRGQYYSNYRDADGHRQKKIKNYETSFVLPSMDAALSKIRNNLLDRSLQKKYPDYTKFRTHTIAGVETLGGQEIQDLRYMNIKQLHRYIDQTGLDIDISLFTEVQELRSAIKLAEEDPEKFKEWILKIGEDKQSKALLRDLNPELFDEEEMADEPVTETKDGAGDSLTI